MNQLRISFQFVYFTFIISALVQSIKVTLENHQTGVALKKVSLGDINVALACTAHFRFLVTWTFRPSRLVSSELLIVERNHLIPSSISHRYEASGTNLFIKKIEERDAGLYECRFKDPHDNEVGRGEYTLIVQIPSTTNATTSSTATTNTTTTSNTTEATTSNITEATPFSIANLTMSRTAEATNLTTFEAAVSAGTSDQLIVGIAVGLLPTLLIACIVLHKKVKKWNRIASSNGKWQNLIADGEIEEEQSEEDDAL